MTKHLVKEEVIAKSVNPITQEMANEGDDADPKFVGGDGFGDAPSLKRGTVSPQLPPQSGSETVGGTDQQQRLKRKIGESQPSESKDVKHRRKKKIEGQKVEEENKDLKFKMGELERENAQLKLEKYGLEKQVLELRVEVKEALVEKEQAVAEKEKAVAEKERAEKINIQKELERTTEELNFLKNYPNHSVGWQGSGYLSHLPKPVQRRATWVEWMPTFLINPSTKLPSLHGREEFLNSISSSIMSLLKYTTTKINAKRRSAVGSDDWEKDFHRIENLCILNSYLEPLREVGSNWVLKSFIREEIYCTLSSYYESQKGKYDKLMALARRIRASTILQSYAGNFDCGLIGFEEYAFAWMSDSFCHEFNSFCHELFSLFKSSAIELLHYIRRFAESLRVKKKPSCPTPMWSGILQSIYEPLRKSIVWNYYELRSFCRLLVVTRRFELRMKKFRTLRSHFDPLNGRGGLFILVKNSATIRSVWKVRFATQATRKPIIVGDLVDDQIVFYEGDLPTEAHYRSEIAILGLGLATWVELEFSD